MNCPKCGSPANKNGRSRTGKQKYICKSCRFNFEGDREFKPVELIELSEQTIGLTEAQLRAKYDIRFIISTKCKELKQGIYLSRAEFVKFCGIRPGQGYTDIINHPDYDAYRGKAGGDVFYSHPDSIKKMKSEGVLT